MDKMILDRIRVNIDSVDLDTSVHAGCYSG